MLRGKLSQLVLLAAYSDWEREGGEEKLELLKLFLTKGDFPLRICSLFNGGAGVFYWRWVQLYHHGFIW